MPDSDRENVSRGRAPRTRSVRLVLSNTENDEQETPESPVVEVPASKQGSHLPDKIGSKKITVDLSNVSIIRKCTTACPYRANSGPGCDLYKQKKVANDDFCGMDILGFQSAYDAFKDGNLGTIKDDAGMVYAMTRKLIFDMYSQIQKDGVIIEEPLTDARGDVIYLANRETGELEPAMKKREHPAIAKINNLVKTIGIDLDSFKLTPVSAKEERTVSGKIISEDKVSIENLKKDINAANKKFSEAFVESAKMLENDPVFRMMKEQGKA